MASSNSTPITAEDRLHLYELMLRVRLVEERIADLYAEQEMRCPVHLSIGQEGAAAGVCAALAHGDRVYSGHRSHGHYIAQGGNLNRMLAEIYGKATGCSGGKGGSMHLIDLDAGFVGATPIVGSTIPIAVGSAFASKSRGEDAVTVTFFGDGATEEGVFHEAINYAVVEQLPVIFACENNLYSVYSPLSVRQPENRQIYEQAAAYGIESSQVNGNNAADVLTATREAVDRARSGGGPTFLEFMNYRWLEHCGPNYDNDIGYRTESEFEAWLVHDPLADLRRQMASFGELDDAVNARLVESITAEIDEAVDFAKTSPFPELETATEDIYSPETVGGMSGD